MRPGRGAGIVAGYLAYAGDFRSQIVVGLELAVVGQPLQPIQPDILVVVQQYFTVSRNRVSIEAQKLFFSCL